jgi:hypothetical protein
VLTLFVLPALYVLFRRDSSDTIPTQSAATLNQGDHP